VLYTAILVGSVVFLSQYKFFSRKVFFESFFMFCFFLSGWRTVKRIFVRKMIANGYHNINVLVIGAGKMGRLVLEGIRKIPWWGFKVVGFLDDNVKDEVEGIPIIGKIEDFMIVLKKHFVDEIIITIPSEKGMVSRIIKEAKNHRVGVRVVPNSFEEPLAISEVDYLGIVPLLTYRSRRKHPTEFFLKRSLDLIVSLMLLIVFSPLFLILAVLIKLDSRGPIFYTQERVGLKGKIFKLFKFRSMIQDADRLKDALAGANEIKDGALFKIRNDPRVTRAGAFLRRYSLDEIPQLYNVLKGDMSLVGPRPPTSDEVRQYDHSHMHRLSIRPGMTGLSQVRGRDALSFKKWVKWDVWYINNWSVGLDIKILWWTVPEVLSGGGA